MTSIHLFHKELSNRTQNALVRSGFYYMEDLINVIQSPVGISVGMIKGIGELGVNEIQAAILKFEHQELTKEQE